MGPGSKVGGICKCGAEVHPFSFPLRIRVGRESFCICEGCSPRYCRNCGAALMVCGSAVGLAGVLGRRRGLTEEEARRLREELEKRKEEGSLSRR